MSSPYREPRPKSKKTLKKRKPKMMMMEKRMEMKEKKRTPIKLKKKIKPKTRKFKDGKEVTHSDAKRRAYYDTFNEYASELAGAKRFKKKK